MRKYGKPAAALLAHKQMFFQGNDAKLGEFQAMMEVYRQQPRRMRCKNCGYSLTEVAFVKMDTEYFFCGQCGHLNGGHEDTDAFCEFVYTQAGGQRYGAAYSAADEVQYRQRLADIYAPKVDFLFAALAEQGEEAIGLSYADMGAGSGYFVGALLGAGAEEVRGYEVSEAQVRLANAMLGGNWLTRHDLADTAGIASRVEADVVSLIGVLEHLQRPIEALEALARNERVRYLYLSVPLAGPCIFFEMAFPQVMPRQLVAGHTHLYTNQSLDWMCAAHGFERVAEWWFGTDLVDLYRSVLVTLGQSSRLSGAATRWDAMWRPALDDLQLALDRRLLSSEVHLLLRKKDGGVTL